MSCERTATLYNNDNEDGKLNVVIPTKRSAEGSRAGTTKINGMGLGEILNVVQDDTSLRFRIGMIRGVISLIYKNNDKRLYDKDYIQYPRC